MALLEIQNLTVEFETAAAMFRAVDGVSLSVEPARCWRSSANPAPASRCPCWP
jgi:ABC-type dipeptide/oligopeptide/nickel transport system ATPase subunit